MFISQLLAIKRARKWSIFMGLKVVLFGRFWSEKGSTLIFPFWLKILKIIQQKVSQIKPSGLLYYICHL